MRPKDIKVECDCGCGEFVVMPPYDKDDDSFILSYNIPAFYAYQFNWESLKIIWTILRGRQYSLYELVVRRKEWKGFIRSLNESYASLANEDEQNDEDWMI